MKTLTNQKASELTKRELFAIMALQGMAADKYQDNKISDDVEIAIQMADQLIEQLNEKK